MKFDRNTIIGFVVLAALFFGYFFYTNKEQSAYRKQKAIEDSLKLSKLPKPDTALLRKDSINAVAVTQEVKAGDFKTAATDTEHIVFSENELLRIAFTTKGGQPKWVELKNFKGQDSQLVKMAASDFDKIGYTINTGGGNSASTTDLNFPKIDSVVNADKSTTISFTLQSDTSGNSITHRYTIRPGNYMIDFDIEMKGANHLLEQGLVNLNWQYTAGQQESDISFEKSNTQVGYVMDDEFDYHSIGRKSSKEFSKSVKWLGVRQRFFFAALVAKSNFTSGKINWEIPADSEKKILKSTAAMKLQATAGTTSTIPLSIYYGPSDFHTLRKYGLRFEKLINLGQGMYSFVRPINRYLIMPVFDLMKNIAGSLGIAIALLTILIRLLISPLTYSSYLSGAKMKALRPEIAKLKAKFGSDQQAMSVEQMKLFREAGVNPLGGCIPALLQIPIFFALYSFFNSEVALRGAHFLWANDLSAFDAVIKFGTKIPLLGSHLSLFTITAVITSFAISIYSMSMTPDQSNPVLKYMPYIFPIFLLFIFNRLPSALTWYYTVSNIITLILQYVIQNYIIDHDKILVKIEENRKKPKTKSKWQERMEQMQEQQKKLKEMKQKGGKR